MFFCCIYMAEGMDNPCYGMLCSLGDCNSTGSVFILPRPRHFVYYIIGTTTLCIAVYIDLFGLFF